MRRGLLALAALASALLVMRLRRRMAVVTVDGDSMWPTFAPGDRVLVRRTGADRLRRGQVVVIEQPGEDGDWHSPLRGHVGGRQWVIKRVAAIAGDPRPKACLPATAEAPEVQVPAGKLVLFGDNPLWSYDSRQMGYFPAERLLGVVVRRMTPGHQKGLASGRWAERVGAVRGHQPGQMTAAGHKHETAQASRQQRPNLLCVARVVQPDEHG
jgi:signal peptidase I